MKRWRISSALFLLTGAGRDLLAASWSLPPAGHRPTGSRGAVVLGLLGLLYSVTSGGLILLLGIGGVVLMESDNSPPSPWPVILVTIAFFIPVILNGAGTVLSRYDARRGGKALLLAAAMWAVWGVALAVTFYSIALAGIIFWPVLFCGVGGLLGVRREHRMEDDLLPIGEGIIDTDTPSHDE